MRRLAIAVVPLALALAGCGGNSTASGGDVDSLLADHGLDGLSTVQVIDRLDQLPTDERPDDLMASVRPDKLVLAGDDEELELPVPEDKFYLSVAPYVEKTHDCFHHSLTTCQGELGGETVDVEIKDADGSMLVARETITFDNGFAGFWLPRGTEGTVKISYDGRTGTHEFGTDADDPTCMTTLRLT